MHGTQERENPPKKCQGEFYFPSVCAGTGESMCEAGGRKVGRTFYRGIRGLECSVFITGGGLVNFDVGRVYKRSVRKCFVAG